MVASIFSLSGIKSLRNNAQSVMKQYFIAFNS